MKKLFHLIPFLFITVCFQACDMLEAHPYDAYVRGEKNLNGKNIQKITANLKDKKEFRFAFISDTQRWYDETEAMVADINKRGDIDFVIHGGDLSDFGATHEFILQRDIMLKFKMPWVALLGNHDCLGTGEDVFARVWGNPNYCFQAGNVLFICLNTNCMEYDYSEPVPDFSFLETLLKNLPESVEKTIVAMHVPPFDLEFNNNVANVFQLYLKEFPNLQFCMNGHAHHYKINEFFNDGILYYQTPCAKDRGYILFTINEEGYKHELIEY
ncbi:MAG: metallophosphoesterase [Bacteroides sp.]|nr:metallophosphoesterase [Bacteroides sp.]